MFIAKLAFAEVKFEVQPPFIMQRYKYPFMPSVTLFIANVAVVAPEILEKEMPESELNCH